jgi:dTDP-glucose 4,6-dehydratase
MKIYLVTGAAGFIGGNFVKHMLRKYDDIRIIALDLLTYAGHLVTIKEDIDEERCVFIHGDIGDRRLIKGLFKRYDIGYVVNFAAESHVDRSIEDPQVFLSTNILGTQNLLEVARESWGKYKGSDVRFHQVSTDEVYGSLGAEGYFDEEKALDPHSPYSASKAGADFIVKAYYDTYGLPVSITRCSNNYGPYHFPEKLIPLVIKNILEGKSVPVYGEGRNVRDWLYVKDHCKAIDLVVHLGKNGGIYNVGGHNEWCNIDIVRLTIRIIRKFMEEDSGYREILRGNGVDWENIEWINDSLISFVKDRLGHDFRYAIDAGKINGELGWKPETDFEEGLNDTIRWYLDNQSWVKAVIG